MPETEKKEGICCPFCGERTVYVKVLTTIAFIAEHHVLTDGLDWGDEEVGTIIGEPAHKPNVKYTKFLCENCGREWIDSMITLRFKDGKGYFEERQNGAFELIRSQPAKKDPKKGWAYWE